MGGGTGGCVWEGGGVSGKGVEEEGVRGNDWVKMNLLERSCSGTVEEGSGGKEDVHVVGSVVEGVKGLG